FKNITFNTIEKYFQQALCCLGNLSRARKPRDGSTLSSFDRSSSQIARSASIVALASRLGGSVPTHFRYTPCIVMSSSAGGANPWTLGYGGARRNWRRTMRSMPPSRSSERRSFAPTSSTSDLQHRDLLGGSDRSAKIATRGLPDRGGNFPDCRFKFPARPQ